MRLPSLPVALGAAVAGIAPAQVGGAGGTIGTTHVARSASDGCTIGFGQWTSHVGTGTA